MDATQKLTCPKSISSLADQFGSAEDCWRGRDALDLLRLGALDVPSQPDDNALG